MISYDPTLIGATPAQVRDAASRSSCSRASRCGRSACAATAKCNRARRRSRRSIRSAFPLSRTLQFRDANLETIALVNGPSDYDGVLVEQERRSGRDAGRASPTKRAARSRRRIAAFRPSCWSRCCRWCATAARCIRSKRSCSRCRSRARASSACPTTGSQRLEQHSPERRQVLSVARLVGGSPADAAAALGRSDPRHRRRRRESLPRSRARRAEAVGARDGAARRQASRSSKCRPSRSAAAISIASSCGRAQCCRSRIARLSAQRGIRAGRRVRRVLLVRLAGDALSAVGGPPHRRGRRSADAGSRCVHQGGRGPRGSLLAAPAHR